ncbi:cytidine deaminase [Paraburkholderia hospita]|uniref:cytidine deaminase n=1 Tax=Paraburkholderia hospita TaxID=169430 RepID=UPI0009A85C1F|nr:cytidine deaminase [Paraburkholderia hospita]SKC69589.1 cytidine deaminase [Paraburkholderia hospita]
MPTTPPERESCLSTRQRRTLLSAARAAAKKAYAKYSNFNVGAAVLMSSGEIFTGANIENASYGLLICAERVALARATVEAKKRDEIVAIAIACGERPSGGPLAQRVPCGACRQWIQELAPAAEILLAGESKSYHIKDFLPHPFSLPDDAKT